MHNPPLAAVLEHVYEEQSVREARRDINAFMEFCFVDEKGQPFKQAPVHRRWHQLARDNKKLVLIKPPEMGATKQFTIGATIYALGADPMARILLIANTSGQGEDSLQEIRENIERNQQIRRVFPNLRPSSVRGAPWNQTEIQVERPVAARDPSVQVIGAFGPSLSGRKTRIVLDDAMAFSNTWTQTQRDKFFAWVMSSDVIRRLHEDGEMWMFTNTWHPDDTAHRIARLDGWHAVVDPACDWDDETRTATNLLWPEKWSAERLRDARAEMTFAEFARQFLCVARDDTMSRFKEAWFALCARRGKGLSTETTYTPQRGERALTGADTALRARSDRDSSCMFSGLVLPNGDRRILSCESGKWTYPERRTRATGHHSRYRSVVIVETNTGGSGQPLVDDLAEQGVPCVAVQTRDVTRDALIDSMAAEFEAGRWIIPSGEDGATFDPEIEAWMKEVMWWRPGQHPGDRLMASVMFREGAGPVRLNDRRGNMAAKMNPEHEVFMPTDAARTIKDGW